MTIYICFGMIREVIKAEMERQGVSKNALHRLTGIRKATLIDYLHCRYDMVGRNIENVFKVLKIKLKTG